MRNISRKVTPEDVPELEVLKVLLRPLREPPNPEMEARLMKMYRRWWAEQDTHQCSLEKLSHPGASNSSLEKTGRLGSSPRPGWLESKLRSVHRQVK
jgi:hypothetical protein